MRGRGQQDLIAFLRALDDPDFDRTVPAHLPSGLPVGGRLQQVTETRISILRR